ncbi:PQQ-binding-like beta-propeller repeat protein [Actinoplanes sp. NPDC026670]|uniref:outer membrane protein assembly factor BamB family protein n=1 Tax=Actinoplanes sp. NPDC026670 TaxID=3154700 RepID=UPI0033CA496D
MAGPGPEDETQPAEAEATEVRFTAGLSEAATPTPTPVTVPAAAPDGQTYAEPVDPWATAEAAAIAAGGQPGGYTPHPHPEGTWTVPGAVESTVSSRRRLGLIIGGAATAVVVLVAAVATVLLWPKFPALDYHSLREVGRVAPEPAFTSTFVDSEVYGDRAFFAGVTEAGPLHTVAVDTGTGTTLWQNDSAGTAYSWKWMYAREKVVVFVSGVDPTTSRSRVVALSSDDGRLVWDEDLGSSDELYLASDVVLWVNREAKKLTGLDLADGTVKWSVDDPDSTTLLLVTGPDDVNGPAGTGGRPFAPAAGDKQRFVQIDSDRTVSVRDVRTGDVLQKRAEVASTGDKVAAHDGRLYVLEPGTTKRVFRYDLAKLADAQPESVYTVAADESLDELTPCGNLLCFVATTGYDRKAAVVRAVGGEGGWEKTVPGAESLVSVGSNGLLAISDEGTTLFVGGKQAWYRLGVTVRLDARNVLSFSDALTSSVSDRELSGTHLGEESVNLGVLQKVRSDTCSWNTSVVVCAEEKEYVVYSFA